MTKFVQKGFASIRDNLPCGCHEPKLLGYIPINHNLLKQNGFGQLEKSFDLEILTKKCDKCHKSAQVKLVFNEHILFIDVQSLEGNPPKIEIKQFQKKFVLNRGNSTKTFVLKAVIEHMPLYKIGHFVANVYRRDCWYCYDDLNPNGPSKSNDSIVPTVLIYIVE